MLRVLIGLFVTVALVCAVWFVLDEQPPGTAPRFESTSSEPAVPDAGAAAVAPAVAPAEGTARTAVAPTAEQAGTPGAVLLGTVFDGLGSSRRPLAGATVVLGRQYRALDVELSPVAQVTTDAAGIFRIEVAAAERRGDLLLEARAADRVAIDWLQVWPDAEQAIGGLELSVVESATLAGRVVGPDRAGVAGAAVQAWIPGAWRRRRAGPHPRTAYVPKPRRRLDSDEHGAFSFVAVPRDEPWRVVGRDGGLRGQRDIDAITSMTVPLEIVLVAAEPEASVRLFGVVIGPDGGGVGGARVVVSHNVRDQTLTDGDGSFEIEIPHATSKCFLLASAAEHTVAITTLEDVRADVGPIALRLERGLAIRGLLCEPDGSGIVGKFVRIDGEPELFTNSVPAPTTLTMLGKKLVRTDQDGRFEFANLSPDVSYRLTYRDLAAPNRFAIATTEAGVDDLRLEIGVVVGPHHRWDVQVRDAISGAGVSAASVDVSRKLKTSFATFGVGVGSGVTDADGGGSVVVASDGASAEYSLSVSAPGYADGAVAAREYAPGVHRLQVELLPERSVTVRVLEADGLPAVEASVEVCGADGRTILVASGRGGRRSPVQTDDSGRVALHGLPAEEVTLKAWLRPERSTTEAVDLRPAVERVIDLWLPAP